MKNKCLILSLLALCLTSCTNYPRDFVEFKNVVKNRQETATSLKDLKLYLGNIQSRIIMNIIMTIEIT